MTDQEIDMQQKLSELLSKTLQRAYKKCGLVQNAGPPMPVSFAISDNIEAHNRACDMVCFSMEFVRDLGIIMFDIQPDQTDAADNLLALMVAAVEGVRENKGCDFCKAQMPIDDKSSVKACAKCGGCLDVCPTCVQQVGMDICCPPNLNFTKCHFTQ
jgi:hypothetical protein